MRHGHSYIENYEPLTREQIRAYAEGYWERRKERIDSMNCESCRDLKVERCEECDEQGTIPVVVNGKHIGQQDCPLCLGTKEIPCQDCQG